MKSVGAVLDGDILSDGTSNGPPKNDQILLTVLLLSLGSHQLTGY